MEKLAKAQLDELSVSYLNLYPAKQKMYATEDGNFFVEKNPAQDHANKTGSALLTYEREKEVVSAPPVDPAVNLEALKETLKAADVEKMEYNAAKALLGALSLVAESGKKADVLKALANYKAEISQ